MKNFTQKILIPVSIVTSTVYAGGSNQMLPTSVSLSNVVPYIDVMAGQNWGDSWMGRTAIGLMLPYNSKFSFTSELGWDSDIYFDIKGSSAQQDGTNHAFWEEDFSSNYHGFDLLFGAQYNFNPKFAAFLKVGGLALNQTGDVDDFTAGNISTHTTINSTKIMPDAMVGLEYNFNPMVGVFVSYTHAFGNVSTSTPTINVQHSINATMGGVEIHLPNL